MSAVLESRIACCAAGCLRPPGACQFDRHCSAAFWVGAFAGIQQPSQAQYRERGGFPANAGSRRSVRLLPAVVRFCGSRCSELQRSCPGASYHRIACGPGASGLAYAEQQREYHCQQISGSAADRQQGAAVLAETMIQEIDAGGPLEVPLREDPAWADLQPFDLSSGACCCSISGSFAGKCRAFVLQAIKLAHEAARCRHPLHRPELAHRSSAECSDKIRPIICFSTVWWLQTMTAFIVVPRLLLAAALLWQSC